MSQKEEILKYLKTHGSITARQAAKFISCMRLAARIAELKADGYPIVTEMITVRTKSGTAVVARYKWNG